MTRLYKLLITAALSTPFMATSQQTDLDPITVTSSFNPLRSSETGRSVVVIKGEKLNTLPVHSIEELLKYVPGMEVQARGPFGAQSDFNLRGGTFQQVLVIVDGVRVNDPNTGHFSSYIPIAPAEIDRIEVLKGAASAVYGSDAVGGVIHIITKSFAAAANDKMQVTAEVKGGEYDLFSANAGVFKNTGKTSFGLGLLSNNTDGQLQRGTRGFVNAHTASASVSHRFTDKWNVALRSAIDSRKFSAQNFYTTFASDTAEETVQTFWNQLQLNHTSIGNTLSIQLGYKALSDSFAFNSRAVTNQNKSRLLQAVVLNERRLSPTTLLTPGVQFVSKNIRSNDRGNHTLNQGALFLLLNQKLGQSLTLAPAARLEYNQRSGWEFVPQMNLSYRLPQIQLRASAGKTIRDADFTERFNNYNKSFVASGRIGNPDLEAERSLSYEAGADFFAGKHLKLSTTFFQRFHKKLIDYVTTPYSEMPRKTNLSPTGTYALAKNISEVTTSGIEAEANFQKDFSSNSSLWTTVGAIWLNSESSSSTPSFYISSHAKFLSNFNIVYKRRFASLALNGIYKSREPQKAGAAITPLSAEYFLLNGKLGVSLLQNKLTLFAEVDNIFNRKYSDLLGAVMPGRWFLGGLQFNLSKN